MILRSLKNPRRYHICMKAETMMMATDMTPKTMTRVVVAALTACSSPPVFLRLLISSCSCEEMLAMRSTSSSMYSIVSIPSVFSSADASTPESSLSLISILLRSLLVKQRL
eukprot:TRINITY_DN612_c0_g5_i1.p3 TRINITY_DN612_c0_g5~~TRINITY_DN612_c0_g5_i1.p3  ORF type:complete len:111 (-),score=15.14 TRINITY_DN612_c0_g5_i1:897-1229(-)